MKATEMMSEQGKQMIDSATQLADRARKDVDAIMLHSMASALRGGFDFSFNPEDMADLLDRVAADRIIRTSTQA